MRRGAEMHDPPPFVTKYDENEEQSESRGRHDEEVDRRHASDVIFEECSPCLRRRLRMARQVFRYGCLRDFEAELQQLSVNSRRAPKWVLAGHPTDKVADLPRQGRSPRFSSSRLPGPEESEPLSVPTDNGLRLDDDQRLAPARSQAREDDPENPIDHPKRWPRPFPLHDSHLLAEGEHFCVERRAAQKGLADDGEEDFDCLMHAGEGIRR